MKKIINKNNYKIIINDSKNYSEDEINKIIDDALSKIKVKDVPYYAPEDEIEITHTEKISGGKNALTKGMLESALKDKWKDGGKTFEAYYQTILSSLKDDIDNARYIVSGQTEDTRKKLLEEYVNIETILRNGNEKEKLMEFKPLVDQLSDKLGLDRWRRPKFPEQKRVKGSNELRMIHRYDSKITHKYAPVFLCTPNDLKTSYIDAKAGKLPEVFESNLMKVQKDIEADYDRINQGRDTYVEDPLINQTLPDIIKHYENATKYAKDLGYTDYAREFEFMLDTIKKAWGLAGE